MEDIKNRADIKLLIDKFYTRVLADDLIGYFFTEIAVVEWDKHIAVMYDFWESVLFGKASYKGNPMLKHIQLSRKEPMTAAHFNRWLTHWETTITENFKGERAKDAVARAKHIGALMKFKIEQATQNKNG